MNKVPKYNEMYEALLEALKFLGGIASAKDTIEQVTKALKLSDEQMNVKTKYGQHALYSYNLHWTKYYLVRAGYINNDERGVWKLTPLGWKTDKIDVKAVLRIVSNTGRSSKEQEGDEESLSPETVWRYDVVDYMLDNIDGYQFEVLCKQLLDKLDFAGVEITSRSNDKGIDGFGYLKINQIVSFKVVFQCKRHRGSVGSPDIDKLVGAARRASADRTLFITTSSFTPPAKENAKEQNVDLINGDDLAELMLQHKLGVNLMPAIDKDYFDQFQQS